MKSRFVHVVHRFIAMLSCSSKTLIHPFLSAKYAYFEGVTALCGTINAANVKLGGDKEGKAGLFDSDLSL